MDEYFKEQIKQGGINFFYGLYTEHGFIFVHCSKNKIVEKLKECEFVEMDGIIPNFKVKSK